MPDEQRRQNDTLIKDLKNRLYGENWDKGDIPAIREQLAKMNGEVNKHRIWLVALTVIILGSGSSWLVNLLG